LVPLLERSYAPVARKVADPRVDGPCKTRHSKGRGALEWHGIPSPFDIGAHAPNQCFIVVSADIPPIPVSGAIVVSAGGVSVVDWLDF